MMMMKLNAKLKHSATVVTLLAFVATGCGPVSITETIMLETDTYISSVDPGNHSTLETLNVSKTPGAEERTILKLPSKQKSTEDAMAEAIADAMLTFFFLPLEIIARMFGCNPDTVVQPANLKKAELVLDVAEDTEGALASKLELALLAKPWWQAVNWTRAHPFSSTRGSWSAPGGDMDPSFTPVANTLSGTTVSFDITQYFHLLISNGGSIPHYGFLVKSVGASMNQVKLRSVQNTASLKRPRVLATYEGAVCTGTTGTGMYQTTYILGDEPQVFTQKLE